MTDDLRHRLLNIEQDSFQVERSRYIPEGWHPGVTWEGDSGEIVTDPLDAPPGDDWSEILAARGLDPAKYEVVGDPRWCSWDGWKRDEEGNTYSAICYSFRAFIRRKTGDLPLDAEKLWEEAKKVKPPKRQPPEGEGTLLVALSDWQAGNSRGGGAQSQVEALYQLTKAIPRRVSEMRKLGYPVGTVALAGLGDLVEGCVGHYANQAFTIELDRREQVRLVRRAVFELVRASAKVAAQVTVTAVGGNHGENRKGKGNAFTTKADNDDVAAVEQVADICAANPDAFGHVGFRLPTDRLAIALNLSGQNVAFTHGHIAKARKNAADTMWEWWHNQAFGRYFPGVADSEHLVVGHFHHLNVKEQEGRTLFIAPSLTRVSDYYGEAYGVDTRPGTLSIYFDESGWDHLRLLE